jgi:ankyrin repeat protein
MSAMFRKSVLSILGGALLTPSFIFAVLTGRLPSRVQSVTDLRVRADAGATSWEDHKKKMNDFLEANNFTPYDFERFEGRNVLPLIRLGEKLGFRRLPENEDLLTVDISWPVIREYAEKVLGDNTIYDEEAKEKLRRFLGTYAVYDLRAPNSTDVSDFRYSRLKDDPKKADEFVKYLCEGDEKLFDPGELPPEYVILFKARLKELLFNYSGFQRIMAMKTVQILNSTDEYSFDKDKAAPIKIRKIADEKRDTTDVLSHYFLSKRESRKCSQYCSADHSVALVDSYFKKANSTLMHEITHAYHFMLMPPIHSLEPAFIHSVLNSPFDFLDMLFPMLREDRVREISGEIAKYISDEYVGRMKKEMAAINQCSNKVALNGIFETLIKNGFASVIFGSRGDEKLSVILTKEMIAKAVYVYCVIFRDGFEAPLISYAAGDKVATSWYTCEEVITMLGMVPFYTSDSPRGQKRTIALVDRQNQFVYEWREREEDKNYMSEEEAKIFGHHSPLFPPDFPTLFSAAVTSVLKSIGIGCSFGNKSPFWEKVASLLSAVGKKMSGKLLPYDGRAAFPESFLYSDEKDKRPVLYEKTVDEWLDDYISAIENKLLTAIDTNDTSSFDILSSEYLSILFSTDIRQRGNFITIKKKMMERGDYFDRIDRVYQEGRESDDLFATGIFTMRIGDGFPPSHLVSPFARTCISAYRASGKKREEYDGGGEKYAEDAREIQHRCYDWRELLFVKNKPIIKNIIDYMRKSEEILKNHGMTSDELDRTTPLHVAVLENKLDAVIEIIEEAKKKGVDINARDWSGETAMHLVRSIEMANILVNDGGADVKAEDFEGVTSLFSPAAVRFGEVVDLLCGKGVNPNKGDKENNTPLHRVFSVDAARALLKHDARVDAKNDAGKTPLHMAKSAGIVGLLVEKMRAKNGGKIDINLITDAEGQTPLHCAGSVDVARALLDCGARTDVKNDADETPLHTVKSAGVLELLLSKEVADVNAKNKEGLTPLHIAVTSPHFESLEIIRVLLTKANPDTEDDRGNSPLYYAPSVDIAKLLLEAKAKIKVDGEGRYAKNSKVNDFLASVLLQQEKE